MKQFLALVTLLILAACAQAPVLDDEAVPTLASLKLGTAEFDLANGLAKHNNGVYVVGQTDGNLYGTNKGNSDVFLGKYGIGGAILWGRQFGTRNVDFPEGVVGDGSNNAYVVGSTSGNLAGSSGAFDGFLRKYSSSGGVVWTRQFGSPADDTGNGVATYGANAIYVVGRTNGNLAGSQGGYDAFIRKYSASGTVLWTRQFGDSQDNEAIDVAVDGSGNVYVLSNVGSGALIRKYSASGTVIWDRRPQESLVKAMAVSGTTIYVVGEISYYGGAATSNTWLEPYTPTDDDEYENIDVWVAKYATSGAFVWEKSFGSNVDEDVFDVSADSTGVVFAGRTEGSFAEPNRGTVDGYVYKLNGSGSYLWGQQQGTPGSDGAHAVLIRNTSEVYAGGYTERVLGGTNHGETDAFLRRINGNTGSTVWTKQ